jgi:bacterioferritin
MKQVTQQVTQKKAIEILQTIMEFELVGVLRYTYYSLVVTASNKKNIVNFLKEQANESLTHGQLVGELLVSLDGCPKIGIAPIPEINDFSAKNILTASLAHEKQALELYKLLLESAKDVNVTVEEFARNMIEEEGSHHLEIEEMLRNSH